MDNRHCLSYTIGKKDKMERMYLLVEIRSKFGNGLECSFSKSMNWRTPRSFTEKCGQDGMHVFCLYFTAKTPKYHFRNRKRRRFIVIT